MDHSKYWVPSEGLYWGVHCYTSQTLHSPTGCLPGPEQRQDCSLFKNLLNSTSGRELWRQSQLLTQGTTRGGRANSLLQPRGPASRRLPTPLKPHEQRTFLLLVPSAARGPRNPFLALRLDKSSPNYTCLWTHPCLTPISQILVVFFFFFYWKSILCCEIHIYSVQSDKFWQVTFVKPTLQPRLEYVHHSRNFVCLSLSPQKQLPLWFLSPCNYASVRS